MATTGNFGAGQASNFQGSGAFNSGIDLSVSMSDENNTIVDFGGEVLDFTAAPVLRDLTISPISNNGEPDHKDVRDGWTGSIVIARYTAALDILDDAQERLYHENGRFKKFTITARINNILEGTTSIQQFRRCAVRIESIGSFRKENTIEQTLSFRASRRILLAA